MLNRRRERSFKAGLGGEPENSNDDECPKHETRGNREFQRGGEAEVIFALRHSFLCGHVLLTQG